MATNDDACDLNKTVHVQNYSILAIKSFIAEVKNYGIIYNGNSKSLCGKALIDFAWTRIASNIIASDLDVKLNIKEVDYWELSLRSLWSWIKMVLKIDMVFRNSNTSPRRRVQFVELFNLKFLEPFIDLSDSPSDSDMQVQSNANITVDIKSADQCLLDTKDNSCVYWLKQSTEPTVGKRLYISVCFRNPEELLVNPSCRQGRQRIYYKPVLGNAVDIIEDVIAEENTVFITGHDVPKEPPVQSQIPNHGSEFETFTMPHLSVDDDYDYIMSLLPRLKNVSPDRRAELKVKLINALEVVL